MRSFFEYRDLGIEAATGGAAMAHISRAVPEMLEIFMPAAFATEEVAAVEGHGSAGRG